MKYYIVVAALVLANLLSGCSLDMSYSASCGKDATRAKYESGSYQWKRLHMASQGKLSEME